MEVWGGKGVYRSAFEKYSRFLKPLKLTWMKCLLFMSPEGLGDGGGFP